MNLNNFVDFKSNIKSNSQLGQDALVLWLLEEKNNGYFVEFGAADGVNISNTFLLEKDYGWSGILCEPARVYKDRLSANRKCTIVDKCVYSKSGDIISFFESENEELSTISSYKESDLHSVSRINGLTYDVETISLSDLLNNFSAPDIIDYLSMDTEGSEFDIIKEYDFSRHINIITVEHNYSSNREKINKFLEEKNFIRIFDSISEWDDWYINAEIK
jgi:FkbM family methyltransferase